MAQKSRDLDRQLAEIIMPLGFRRIPKTRYFIRLFGDGVLQGIHWYHEPRYQAQELEIWINSTYADPDYLFRPYLSWYDNTAMICSVSCASYVYQEDEFIPTRVFCDVTEEEQMTYFQEQVLPRFERWATQEDVFRARQGSEMASAKGYPLFSPWYRLGRDLNLAMFLNLTEEVEQYLDEPVLFLDFDPQEQEEFKQKRDVFRKGNLWHMDEFAQNYLNRCREQNLYDFERVLRGERGTKRRVNEEDTSRPFYLLVRDGETMPIQWGSQEQQG